MDDLHIRFAEPRDSAQIANLFCTGFDPDLARLLIYGCKDASEYIRMQLVGASPIAESAYFVAQVGRNIAGAAEFRRRPKSLFLNYIAVHPDYRGQRIGATLFSAAVGMSGVSGGRIELDVLHNNLRALQWYSRLGFTTKASSEFVEITPPRGADETPAYVSGLAQANLCQARFGFSSFNLITKQESFGIGRIGDRWFRLTDLKAVRNPAIFAALNRLDPVRRVFAVIPASSAPAAQVVRLLAKMHRMEAEILHLMSSFSRDYQKSRELV